MINQISSRISWTANAIDVVNAVIVVTANLRSVSIDFAVAADVTKQYATNIETA